MYKRQDFNEILENYTKFFGANPLLANDNKVVSSGNLSDTHNNNKFSNLHLRLKENEDGTFDSFGLGIIDECHHLGAEVFSKSMRKVASKYMLGLSATPKRKDGLSKVFEGTEQIDTQRIVKTVDGIKFYIPFDFPWTINWVLNVIKPKKNMLAS